MFDHTHFNSEPTSGAGTPPSDLSESEYSVIFTQPNKSERRYSVKFTRSSLTGRRYIFRLKT